MGAIGHLKAGPEKTLFDQYAKRLSAPLTLFEFEEKRPLPKTDRMHQEAKMLASAIPSKALVVMLDEHGKPLTSQEFAQQIEKWQDMGVSDLAFVIGGADGHDQLIRDRADFALGLGRMTWPHMLVRVMLVEQLWRAQSIMSGHPYHRA
jgi:23S rRNA (pseudouridine1915-N3)-methyltransferase